MSIQFLIIVTCTILVAYLIYSKLIRPYQTYKFMSTAISSLYKAYVHPFHIMFPPILTQQRKDYNQYGDSLYSSKLRDCQLSMSMVGTNLSIILYDPELIREFYQKSNDGSYYIKSMKPSVTAAVKFAMGRGLFFSQGAQWNKRRRIMDSMFNLDFIKTKVPLISKASKQALEKFQDFPENRGKFKVQMDLELVSQQIFGNILTRFFFGDVKLNDIGGKSIFAYFHTMYDLNMQRSSSLFSKLGGSRLLNMNLRKVDRLVTQMSNQLKNRANNIITQQIDNFRKQNPENTALTQQQKGKSGILQIMLRQSKLKDERQLNQRRAEFIQTDYYTVNDLAEQFRTFYIAGKYRLSSLSCSFLYQIAQNKEIQERIKKQISDVVGDSLDNITYDQLRELKYLDNCLRETLRMFSPVPELMSRQATRDHYVGQIPVKKGTLITVSILGNHFKSSFYDNPQMFNPDRWDAMDMRKTNQFSFFPFSSGTRMCIGQDLAMIQSKISVMHMLKKYKEIELEKPEVRHEFKVTYAPQHMMTAFIK